MLSLNFVRKKYHTYYLNILIYKVKQFVLAKTISQKSIHVSQDGPSGCASGGIEQVTVKMFLKYDKITLA